MSAGNYDRYLTFQAPVQKRGKAGGVTPQWDYVANAWAQKEDVSGGETRRGTQLVPEASVVFETCHWIDGINTTHRIECEGNVYDVLFIRELGRKERMEIQATVRGTDKP